MKMTFKGALLLTAAGFGCAPTPAPRALEPAEEAQKPCNTAGMICVIVKAFKTTDIVPMATSLRAYREFRKSLLANDRTGLEQMTVTGEIIGPHAGTTVRVLEVSVTDDRAEVRIESGEYAGTRAWTSMSWLNRISN